MGSPDFARANEPENIVVAGTKSSPTITLIVLHDAAIDKSISNDDGDVVAKVVTVASQECLLSSSDKRNGSRETFLYDGMDSLSGES